MFHNLNAHTCIPHLETFPITVGKRECLIQENKAWETTWDIQDLFQLCLGCLIACVLDTCTDSYEPDMTIRYFVLALTK